MAARRYRRQQRRWHSALAVQSHVGEPRLCRGDDENGRTLGFLEFRRNVRRPRRAGQRDHEHLAWLPVEVRGRLRGSHRLGAGRWPGTPVRHALPARRPQIPGREPAEAADTGAVSAADSPGGDYVDCQNNWFRAPIPVSFAGSAGCNVAYRLRLDTEPGFDYFVVDASTDLTFSR